MEKNLDKTNPRYNEKFPQSLGSSLNRGSTVFLSLTRFDLNIIPTGQLSTLYTETPGTARGRKIPANQCAH